MGFISDLCTTRKKAEESLINEFRQNDLKVFNKRQDQKIRIQKAEQCLIDNGIDEDEVSTVLQALGYILLDSELYPNNE